MHWRCVLSAVPERRNDFAVLPLLRARSVAGPQAACVGGQVDVGGHGGVQVRVRAKQADERVLAGRNGTDSAGPDADAERHALYFGWV